MIAKKQNGNNFRCHRKKDVFSRVFNWNKAIKAPSVSSDIQSALWLNYETKAAARFIDRKNDLKRTFAERDKNR